MVHRTISSVEKRNSTLEIGFWTIKTYSIVQSMFSNVQFRFSMLDMVLRIIKKKVLNCSKNDSNVENETQRWKTVFEWEKRASSFNQWFLTFNFVFQLWRQFFESFKERFPTLKNQIQHRKLHQIQHGKLFFEFWTIVVHHCSNIDIQRWKMQFYVRFRLSIDINVFRRSKNDF